MFVISKGHNRAWRAARKVAAATLWRLPGRFGLAQTLDRSYLLRCVVFHDIAVKESSFTKGTGVSITPRDLESALRFLATYYAPVGIQDVLSDGARRAFPPRAVLLTFDDGYASTIEWAVPLCRKYRMPAIFFLNSACIDNKRLAPDNLVCYVVNELGTEVVNAAVRSVKGASAESLKVKSLPDIFSRVLPAISLAERKAFLEALAHLAGIDGTRLAKEAGLYLTREQVNDLANSGFQIGNHTYSHVHCRTLTRSGFVDEIDRNKTELQAMSGRPVRSFSLPYGSSADLTRELAEHLDRSGHELVFLSESTANRLGAKHPHFDRVSIHGRSEDELFCEIEILPRLRGMRNRLFRSRKPVDTCQGAQTWDRLSTMSENHTN